MTRINLLPWREARRRRQQHNFYKLLAVGFLAAAAGVFGVQMELQNRIDNQQVRNNFLREEIARLQRAEQEIRRLDAMKASLLARLEIIQNLQQQRPGMVMVYDELVRTVPEDMYLTSFRVTGQDIQLTGFAATNNVVSDFMRRIHASPRFGEPVLTVVENRDIGRVATSRFELRVRWNRPAAEANGAGGSGS